MRVLHHLRGFSANQRGNIAVIFALASLPLLFFTGAAIDYGLATRLQVKLQAATDATALALCQTPKTTTTAQLQVLAQTMMAGYMGSEDLTIDPLKVTADPRGVVLIARMEQVASFGKVTGTTTLTPQAKAQCASPMPRTFEIALVLDTTGSMLNAGGGMTKMEAAQQAASNFIDYVNKNPAFSPDTRISIVPFAAAVAVDPSSYRNATWIDRAGASPYHWVNVAGASSSGFTSRFSIFNSLKLVRSNWDWAGCLETLPYPLSVQDGRPTSDPKSLFVPMFAPDEPGPGSATLTDYVSNNVKNQSYNSYIDDGTNGGNCKVKNSLSFEEAEARACKYESPAGSVSALVKGVPNGPNFSCTSKPLQRLTTNMSTLKSLITTLSPQGSTNIFEGLMWGWRTLSPNSVFADGVAYSSTTTTKVLILMTDGENTWSDNEKVNYNRTLFNSMGYLRNADGSTPNERLPANYHNISTIAQARGALDALTREACTNVKATNISVYSIGFSTSGDPIDSQGLSLLSNCASSQSQFFVANTADDLIAAFDKIGKSIGTLRLTQ